MFLLERCRTLLGATKDYDWGLQGGPLLSWVVGSAEDKFWAWFWWGVACKDWRSLNVDNTSGSVQKLTSSWSSLPASVTCRMSYSLTFLVLALADVTKVPYSSPRHYYDYLFCSVCVIGNTPQEFTRLYWESWRTLSPQVFNSQHKEAFVTFCLD